jgi:hypothetical protein
VSLAAIQWAWEQPVKPAMRKLVLLAMADCVNAEGAEMVCWPSYAFVASRTGMNIRTVETSVFDLKTEGFLVDTGRRAGTTGKVVVYRLNTPETGGIKPGPQASNANGTRPQQDSNTSGFGGIDIPPKATANPPKNDGQSPQKRQETPPKPGVVTSKGTRNRTGKESGNEAACAALPDVSASLVIDWLAVRKAKHAGPVSETVVEVLDREAARAGLSRSDAIRYCCGAGWQNFTAAYWAKRENVKLPGTSTQSRRPTAHSGLADKDYHQGVSSDGTLV